MKSTVIAFFVAASLTCAASAQTETTTEGDAAADAPAAAEAPKEKVVAVHGDWQVRCRDEGEDQNCFMYQLALDSHTKPVAEVSIVPLAQKDGALAGFTIVTPLKSMLPNGLVVQIDANKPIKYPYLWCDQFGCFARFGASPELLNQYKRGAKARVTVFSVDRPDAPIILDVSLKGFTAAFADLSKN